MDEAMADLAQCQSVLDVKAVVWIQSKRQQVMRVQMSLREMAAAAAGKPVTASYGLGPCDAFKTRSPVSMRAAFPEAIAFSAKPRLWPTDRGGAHLGPRRGALWFAFVCCRDFRSRLRRKAIAKRVLIAAHAIGEFTFRAIGHRGVLALCRAELSIAWTSAFTAVTSEGHRTAGANQAQIAVWLSMDTKVTLSAASALACAWASAVLTNTEVYLSRHLNHFTRNEAAYHATAISLLTL
jgi:hypothetical protein